jgi:hypothetical protein
VIVFLCVWVAPDEAEIPVHVGVSPDATPALLSGIATMNPTTFAFSTVVSPALPTTIADFLATLHAPVATYVAGADTATSRGKTSFAERVWTVMTSSEAQRTFVGESSDKMMPTWAFCQRTDSTPSPTDMCVLLAFSANTGSASPFSGTRPRDAAACVHGQVRWPTLAFPLMGDQRRRAPSHLLTLFASLVAMPFQGFAPCVPKAGGEFTVGNMPILGEVERGLLMNQFSGWTENQAAEVELKTGETLPDIFGATARKYPDVRVAYALVGDEAMTRSRRRRRSRRRSGKEGKWLKLKGQITWSKISFKKDSPTECRS